MTSERTPKLHVHYGAFAGICLYFGLWIIVRSIRGIAGLPEGPELPAEPARRDGAILATVFIPVMFFALAAFFYLNRPKRPNQ